MPNKKITTMRSYLLVIIIIAITSCVSVYKPYDNKATFFENAHDTFLADTFRIDSLEHNCLLPASMYMYEKPKELQNVTRLYLSNKHFVKTLDTVEYGWRLYPIKSILVVEMTFENSRTSKKFFKNNKEKLNLDGWPYSNSVVFKNKILYIRRYNGLKSRRVNYILNVLKKNYNCYD